MLKTGIDVNALVDKELLVIETTGLELKVVGYCCELVAEGNDKCSKVDLS